MANSLLADTLVRVNEMGLMDVIIPFALVFLVVYAVSNVVPHMNEKRNFRVVIALVIALATVVPHVTGDYPPGFNVVEIMMASLPEVMLVLLGIVLVLFLYGATTNKSDLLEGIEKRERFMNWLKLIALVIVILIFLDNMSFGAGYGLFGNVPFMNYFSNPDFQAIALILAVFFLVAWGITGGDKKKEPRERLLKEVEK